MVHNDKKQNKINKKKKNTEKTDSTPPNETKQNKKYKTNKQTNKQKQKSKQKPILTLSFYSFLRSSSRIDFTMAYKTCCSERVTFFFAGEGRGT